MCALAVVFQFRFDAMKCLRLRQLAFQSRRVARIADCTIIKEELRTSPYHEHVSLQRGSSKPTVAGAMNATPSLILTPLCLRVHALYRVAQQGSASSVNGVSTEGLLEASSDEIGHGVRIIGVNF